VEQSAVGLSPKKRQHSRDVPLSEQKTGCLWHTA